MDGRTVKGLMQAASALGFAACIAAAVWGWQSGVLTSQQALERWVAGCGVWGPLGFTAFQAVQVVVPVLPGGLGCLAGVLLFGPVWGFVYNYLGICLGSLLAFGVARSCGKPLLTKLFSQRTIERYSRWTEHKGRFARWFALAIFLPVAPDDFLCYLAGTTEMRWGQFAAIIVTCKPFAIALYSMGLTVVWRQLTVLAGW